MKTLSQRTALACLCVAAALTAHPIEAMAGGNGSLFSSESALIGTSTRNAETGQPRAVLYTDAEPVKLENHIRREIAEAPPEQLIKANARARAPYSEQDLNCMAEAVYHEARGESRQGQAAVAEVILNRVANRNFPSTVCGVVNQPHQFSYTIGGRKPINNKSAYMRARDIAQTALSGRANAVTGGATYFHTPAVRPSWSHRFQRTVQIGSHIFYRRGGGQRVASN